MNDENGLGEKPEVQKKQLTKSKKNREKKRNGRPTAYSEEIAKELFHRMSNGETVKRICQDDHMPNYQTIRNWIYGLCQDIPEGFLDLYVKANINLQHWRADQMQEIAFDASRDYQPITKEYFSSKTGKVINRVSYYQSDNTSVQRDKLKIDTLWRVIQTQARKDFGADVQQTNIQVNVQPAIEFAPKALPDADQSKVIDVTDATSEKFK